MEIDEFAFVHASSAEYITQLMYVCTTTSKLKLERCEKRKNNHSRVVQKALRVHTPDQKVPVVKILDFIASMMEN